MITLILDKVNIHLRIFDRQTDRERESMKKIYIPNMKNCKRYISKTVKKKERGWGGWERGEEKEERETNSYKIQTLSSNTK